MPPPASLPLKREQRARHLPAMRPSVVGSSEEKTHVLVDTSCVDRQDGTLEPLAEPLGMDVQAPRCLVVQPPLSGDSHLCKEAPRSLSFEQQRPATRADDRCAHRRLPTAGGQPGAP
eukprot:5906962-Prymnesium_polylepis.1